MHQAKMIFIYVQVFLNLNQIKLEKELEMNCRPTFIIRCERNYNWRFFFGSQVSRSVSELFLGRFHSISWKLLKVVASVLSREKSVY